LVFATRNRGKLAELRQLLTPAPVEVLTVDDAAARLGRTLADVIEDGDSFAANAAKKAREIAAATGWPALADDSGLEVDALHGAPGVMSARWAGQHGDAAANNARLLAELLGLATERRTARFRCALAFADPAGPLGDQLLTADGAVEGLILTAPSGTSGFGYDPLFYCPELGQTFAASGSIAKGRVSHRGRAMAQLVPRLVAYFAAS
jgi:XTP/dITP diphosphohydrolase